MKILILGAGGIIGQHLRISQPFDVDAIYCRRTVDAHHIAIDLAQDSIGDFLAQHDPDALINLAGESRPDVVERNPGAYTAVNVSVPTVLAHWCAERKRHMVQVSTQAVFGGFPKVNHHLRGLMETFLPPYGPESPRIPVNAYGQQKLMAEQLVMSTGNYWTIVRPTFVLGVLPDPTIGRENPVEQMLAPVQAIAEGETVATQRQVADRFFSVSFAWRVADALWITAYCPPQCKAIHVGIPFRTNRHILASYLRPDINIEAVSHDSFEGLAPRPIDTTYAGEGSFAQIADGLDRCKAEYEARRAQGDTVKC